MRASLETYKAKRNFKKTSEPKGQKASARGEHIFVIQRHEASHLHFDFRLELDGVLKSWAVPKEPLMDPRVKRLAVQVEDHPVAYATFHGDIPEGEYGAGHVEIWDHGHWQPLDPDPSEAYENGHLSFQLKGEKLNGRWTLVRTKSLGRSGKNGKQNWLLIKARDEWAESVPDGAESKTKPHKRAKTEKPKRPPAGATLSPQLAVLVDEPPTGPNWAFENKYDGYRILAKIENGKVRLLSRRGRDWTERFKIIADAVGSFGYKDALIDGEVVALGKKGVSDFQLLQNSLVDPKKQSNLVYYAFDLLELNKNSLEGLPLSERRRQLEIVLEEGKNKHVRLSELIKGRDPKKIVDQACKRGSEGIMCKRLDRPYQHLRSPDWLKVKCKQVQEFVIAGFTDPQGGREKFGALILASRENGSPLKFVGKVGTGFTRVTLDDVFARLKKLASKSSPFKSVELDTRGVHWVKPELVAQIEFRGWTNDGILRQPSFAGLREDKPSKDVRIERPQRLTTVLPESKSSSDQQVTNPDRVLFADAGITKGGLAEYFAMVSERMLPLVESRPLALMRCPGGVAKGCFFQQHPKADLSSEPGLASVSVEENGEASTRLTIESAAGLRSLVQHGVVELHLWGARIQDIEHPDQLVFDLDPDVSVTWAQTVKAAKVILRALESRGLVPFLKLTGGKGVHIHVPIVPDRDWESAHAYSEALSRELAAENPKIFTTTSVKKARKGLIYIDYVRNSRGVSFIAPYSPRARAHAPVAVPIALDELSSKIKPDAFTVANLSKHLAKSDPWADFDSSRRPLKV